MLWRYADKLDPLLRHTYQRLVQPPVPNLKGDRDLEYSWMAAHLPDGPGQVLDFGCGHFWLGLMAARKGFDVVALDRVPVRWFYSHPNLQFVQEDIFTCNWTEQQFDLILNCSSIEHVGLGGRYGIRDSRADGDLEAMAILHRLLKPRKTMLLTMPVGRDAVFSPFHRVYGEQRLPLLLAGWRVQAEEHWTKTSSNDWRRVERTEALAAPVCDHCYGLGLYVLQRAD